jgi:hypothetical protein
MKIETVCPISQEKIDENKARIVALFVVITVGTSVVYLNNFYGTVMLIGLAFDFFIRTFTSGKASPLRFFAITVSKVFRIKPKLTDAAPKKFAAGMGMVFCLIIAALLFFELNLAAQIVAIMLVLCAILESAFGYCLGCKIYTFLQLFKKEY